MTEAKREEQLSGDQSSFGISDPLVELDIAGVHPTELLYAPSATEENVVPILFIDKDSPIAGIPNVDVCDLGRVRRCSVEQMAARELEEGVGEDPSEAFEEALTQAELSADLQN